MDSADRLGVKYINLTGDVLVSAGVMAYLGPFTATFRSGQLDSWVTLCKDRDIPCSTSPTLSGEMNAVARDASALISYGSFSFPQHPKRSQTVVLFPAIRSSTFS